MVLVRVLCQEPERQKLHGGRHVAPPPRTQHHTAQCGLVAVVEKVEHGPTAPPFVSPSGDHRLRAVQVIERAPIDKKAIGGARSGSDEHSVVLPREISTAKMRNGFRRRNTWLEDRDIYVRVQA